MMPLTRRQMAWRVAQDKVTKVAINVGDRDPRTGDYVLKSGLAEGDQVIRYPSAMLKDGQPVQASKTPTTSMAAEGPNSTSNSR